MNCQDFNNLLKLSDFLHFNEIWPMFPPNPMYETNTIQLYFLLWFFWYISQWSGWISSIFCTRLYSRNIHCVTKTYTVHSSPNGLHSDLEAASEAESNPSDAESISESNNYQTNNCSSVNNGKKIKSSFRSTFNLSGAVKNMLQVQFQRYLSIK